MWLSCNRNVLRFGGLGLVLFVLFLVNALPLLINGFRKRSHIHIHQLSAEFDVFPLQNLIANALRYSGTDRIEVASVASRDKVTVTVCDFGIGIAEQHLPHLFERFYRVNKSRSRTLGGTGLGLAIVKHIVRLHGGDVFVSSRPGVKTTFGFTLPIIGDKA